MRLVVSLLVVSLLAAVAAGNALAFRFTDETRIVPAGTAGRAYHHHIGTAAGCQAVRIAVENGSLPPGLQLVGDVRFDAEGSNWRIVGTPTTPGSYSFWLRATSEWPECRGDSTEEPFTINVHGAPTQAPALPAAPPVKAAPAQPAPAKPAPSARPELRIKSTSLPILKRKRAYAVKILTRGGVPIVRHGRQTFRWKVERGRLPVGLRLNTAVGKLIGAPRHAGRYRIVVRATDRTGFTTRQALVVRVHR